MSYEKMWYELKERLLDELSALSGEDRKIFSKAITIMQVIDHREFQVMVERFENRTSQ